MLILSLFCAGSSSMYIAFFFGATRNVYGLIPLLMSTTVLSLSSHIASMANRMKNVCMVVDAIDSLFAFSIAALGFENMRPIALLRKVLHIFVSSKVLPVCFMSVFTL